MRTQRRFRQDFKRRVIEELVNGISSPAQIIRRYEISLGLVYPRPIAFPPFLESNKLTTIFPRRRPDQTIYPRF